MALKKITLQLGSKTISLTKKQFEELKADMRELDKQHNYYWHNYHWYEPWYRSHPILYGTASGTTTLAGNTSTNTVTSDLLLSANTAGVVKTIDKQAAPPAFSGSILSAA